MNANVTTLEGAWLRQDAKPPADRGAGATASAASPPLLMDKHELGKMLDIGQRKLHQVLQEDWMPRGIELGPRCVRWNRDEVAAALAQRAPRREARAQPVELENARARRKVPA